MAERYRIKGVIHPPPERYVKGHRLYMGPCIREDEVGDFMEQLAGGHVVVDHDYDKYSIGRIGNEFARGPNGSVIADLEIDLAAPGAKETIRKVESGEWSGLSIGTFLTPHGTEPGYSHLQPFEISICEEGAIPGTHILSFGTRKRQTLNTKHIMDTLMEEPATVLMQASKTAGSSSSSRGTCHPDWAQPYAHHPDWEQHADW